MNHIAATVACAVCATFSGSPIFADVCENRPSARIGGVGTGVLATTGVGVSSAGVGMTAAGFYTFPHAAGLTMLGSTAGGVSGAGTVGIMGGTGGAVGTIGAILLAPEVIVVAAAVGTGIGGFEGVCAASDWWYAGEISDPITVRIAVFNWTNSQDPSYVQVVRVGSDGGTTFLALRQSTSDAFEVVDLDSLYIEGRDLKSRQWLADQVVVKDMLPAT